MTLDDFKNFLYKERQAVDALATTVKTNMASLMAILAAIAIPFVPALFAANGVYVQTTPWGEDWRKWAAIATAVAIEGAGMFLSILTTKTYSAWQKKAATIKEIYAMAGSVGIYTIIVVVLITLSNIPWGLKIIIALIPLLGVSFYIGMGFETDLANRLDEIADEKRRKREERKIAGKLPKTSGNFPELSRGLPEWLSVVPKTKEEFRQLYPQIPQDVTSAEIAEYLPVGERQVRNWIIYARNGQSGGNK